MPRDGSLYLHEPPGSLDVLLAVWVAWLCPVRVDGDGDEPSLPGPVGLVVEVPDLGVCLDQVVSHGVGSAPRPSRHAWGTGTGSGAALPCPLMAASRINTAPGHPELPRVKE